MNEMKDPPKADKEGIIAGRNAVLEALKGKDGLEKIFVQRGEKEGSIVRIIALAREKGVPVQEADRVKLQHLCGMDTHQGVVAYAKQKEYCTVEDILAAAAEKGEPPFLVICDGLNDPHNFGAIIRTAEAAGVHGVIIPKNRSVGITPTVTKASAGAVFHLPVAKVSNTAQTIDFLKAKGVWVYGTDAAGTKEIFKTDMTGAAAIVIGSEGEGLGRLVREKCDFLVSIPMGGKINSLNASVAAGILIYEIVRQRKGS